MTTLPEDLIVAGVLALAGTYIWVINRILKAADSGEEPEKTAKLAEEDDKEHPPELKWRYQAH